MSDLGVLSAHVLHGFQKVLFTRLAEAGEEHLRPRHGAVMAYLKPTVLGEEVLERQPSRHQRTRLLDVASAENVLVELGVVLESNTPTPACAEPANAPTPS